MFRCPHCNNPVTVSAPAIPNGTLVDVVYSEVAEIDADESEGEGGGQLALAVVLGTVGHQVKIAWVLKLSTLTLRAGHRRPHKTNATHAVDSVPVMVGRASVTEATPAAEVVLVAGVYTESAQTLDSASSYAAYLAKHFI